MLKVVGRVEVAETIWDIEIEHASGASYLNARYQIVYDVIYRLDFTLSKIILKNCHKRIFIQNI